MGRELENNDASYLDLLTAAARKASPGPPMTLGIAPKAILSPLTDFLSDLHCR